MTGKLNDLVNIFKSKYTKEDLTDSLSQFDFITLSDDQEQFTYNLSEQLTLISILNLPHSLNRGDIINLLKLDGDYLRFYKKSLFWVLVTEDKDLVNKLEVTLKEDLIVIFN
jgi:hypothetical protein